MVRKWFGHGILKGDSLDEGLCCRKPGPKRGNIFGGKKGNFSKNLKTDNFFPGMGPGFFLLPQIRPPPKESPVLGELDPSFFEIISHGPPGLVNANTPGSKRFSKKGG